MDHVDLGASSAGPVDSSVHAAEKSNGVSGLPHDAHPGGGDLGSVPPASGEGALAGFPTWETRSTPVATPRCPHYARHCHLRAACCNALVACRRCHDALVPDGHPMDRRAVKFVKCLTCNSEDQPLGPVCVYCGVRFARYFCGKCAMYDDTPGRDIFHCDGCGVCRAGKAEDYRHCDTCRVCLPVKTFDGHVCTKQVLHGPCSVCGMDMQESVRRCVIPPCGHAMHQGCFEFQLMTSFGCGTCGKSLMDMSAIWNRLDDSLRGEMQTIVDMVFVECRDCGSTTKTKRHGVFQKCMNEACGSYSTVKKS